eukprot:CAMPEP_0113303942 /NCGR_PEP_ID=MMETSP0010_2-20120614/4141_1 /TAXON_ID=216773 ORGANISM="Corethron hystrix, Strain 308" /NCGR_SAMPLE_ID=MMETSP0010_2 /ASSEMBLY_ACC=CAM_ASM_000155 /LENGTH=472 /DNA_ID=CAMNT_0000158009 /DNA_START=1222 /DNA_END=2641 /DNA_ORIENTATION=+ /assembly_acc=CAM_ASM_000155
MTDPQESLRVEGYDHREALFGVPPYGGSIAEQVYYTDENLCDADIDIRQNDWKSPFILMVDRGECTFVHKVRNAQKAGAAGVLIADNICLCDFASVCKPKNEGDRCEQFEPVMADDGSGSDITIPAFLLFKQDADVIREELLNYNANIVMAEMTWNIPRPDDRVEYKFWTTPTEHISKNFQKSFGDAALRLGDSAVFTPHFFVYDGILNRCHGSNGNACSTMCTNAGRYCAADPDNDLYKGISGSDVVRESLRRICIWKYYGKDKFGEKWWSYTTEFMERCDSPSYFSNNECVNDAYKHSGVDGKKINQCMGDSGGLQGDSVNNLLQKEIAAKDELGVVVVPSVFVNNIAMRGKLSSQTVFSAICHGYLDGTEPDICNKCASCNDFDGCIQKGKCGDSSLAGVSMNTFISTIFLVSGLIVAVGLAQWRKSQKQMRNEVRGILAEYMPLEEDAEDGNFAFAKRSSLLQGTQIE